MEESSEATPQKFSPLYQHEAVIYLLIQKEETKAFYFTEYPGHP